MRSTAGLVATAALCAACSTCATPKPAARLPAWYARAEPAPAALVSEEVVIPAADGGEPRRVGRIPGYDDERPRRIVLDCVPGKR